MLFLVVGSSSLFGQLSATFTQTANTICNGSGCNYSGPTILINEIMMSPTTFDGCLSGTGGTGGCRGEWIELYNPDLCQPIDISCYYLGSTVASGSAHEKEAFILPAGTIIPAGGFCLVRGENGAPVPSANLVQNGGNVVEIVMPGAISGTGICTQGTGGLFGTTPTRFWFPNSGGWFAFYDRNGVPQDAVFWGSGSAPATGNPCIPTRSGCNNSVSSLAAYADIPANRKTKLYNGAVPDSWGQSIRRVPDGGSWVINAGTSSFTVGGCNDVCATLGSSSCDATATINVTGGTAPYSYHWSDSQGQLTQTATALCAGNYTVNVTDNVGVTGSFNVQILNYVPTVSVSIVDQVCIDLPAFATTISPVATAGQTGVLSGNGVSGTNFNPQTAGAGTHTLTYVFTDEHGCTNTATDAILVNPLPVVSVTVDNPYCISATPEQFVLTPAGGTLSGPGVSGTNFTPSVAGVGNHAMSYAYTDANGCSRTATASAQVVALPTPSITAPDFICSDAAPITLQGSPAGGTFSINSVNTAVLNPATSTVGMQNLSYDYTDANGCNAVVTDQIDVLPAPVVTLVIQPDVCIDGGIVAATVSPTTGGTGTLTGTGVTGTNFNPQTAGLGLKNLTYSFTTTQGCSNTATDDITVHPLPVVTFTGIDPTYCLSNTPVTFNLQPAGGTLSGPGVTNNTFVSATAGIGTHALTYTFTDANSCTNATTQNVVVVAGPAPAFTIPDFLCNYAPAITLSGTPAGGIFTVDGAQATSITPSTIGNGTHTVVYAVTDANNCIGTASESINILPRPALSTNLAAHYCNYSTIVPLTLTPPGGTLTGDYTIASGLNLTNATPGNHSITYNYTDANGCENTMTDSYVFTSPIFPKFSYTTNCFQVGSFFNETVPTGNYGYSWDFGTTGSATSANPSMYFPTFGDHYVTLSVSDSYQCVYDTTQLVYVVEGLGMQDFVMPNVITPNGDGINDVLTLPAQLDECVQYKILILNRWGNVVYEMDGPNSAFKGEDKGGKDLLAGVYFYLVQSDDFDCSSAEYKGFCSGIITIIREK